MRVNEIPVQQAAGAKVTRPLPSLAEWGVATRDYVRCGENVPGTLICFWLI